jgi:hypothetical protein
VITAVDTNILIDILEPDPVHGLRSKEALKKCLREGAVVACDVVWAEVATAYGHNSNELVEALRAMRIGFSAMSMEAALGAARSWHNYRRRRGTRSNRCGFSDRRSCNGTSGAAVDARPWFLQEVFYRSWDGISLGRQSTFFCNCSGSRRVG